MPAAVDAGVDGDVVLGAANSETTTTMITNTAAGFTALYASATGHPALFGVGGPGVLAQGAQASDSGVVGLANGVASPGTAVSPSTGVYGESGAGNGVLALSGAAAAVLGRTSGASSGVQGFSGSGIGDLPPAPEANTGVFGSASADLGVGVRGTGASTLTSNSTGVIGDGDTGVLGVGTFGVLGSAAATGIGVYGSVSNTAGVPAVFGKTGVIGQTDAGGTGVVGFTGLTAPTPPADTGIYGVSSTGGANGRGLTGYCATGVGLLGQTSTGVGVRAYCANNTGVGLRVTGKAAFDRSGKLTIAAGTSSITKTGIGLTSASFILATLQTNVAGLFIQAVVTNVAGSAFTIYLSKAPTIAVAVAWLAVN